MKKGVSVLLDVLASCLMPLIRMLMAASLFKTIAAIIGPDMLGLVDAKDDLYVLLSALCSLSRRRIAAPKHIPPTVKAASNTEGATTVSIP